MKIPEQLKNSGVKLPEKDIKRSIITEIAPWMERDEVIVLIGSRQTGKTVLLFQIIRDIILKKTNRVFYYNLDIKDNLKKIENPDYLINLTAKNEKKTYIIIDEIQRIKEPGLFLKGLYDLHLPVKFLVSGSSALEIRGKINEAMTGRKQNFHVSPFNMEELAAGMFPKMDFAEVYSSKENFEKVLNHFMVYGSYPAVAMAGNGSIKKGILKEIFSSYIEKDVKAFLKVENETAFINLIRILASQIGNLLNKNELSGTLGIHKNTLDKYLYYLEQTFLVDFISPYFKNPRKEILKSPKIYFSDMGIRSTAIDFFGKDYRPDSGSVFENTIYLLLKNKCKDTGLINYWRTKTGAEVDFILGGHINPIPLEIKAGALKKPKLDRGFRSFFETYKPEKGYYINRSLNGMIKLNDSTIEFITPDVLCASKIFKA